MGWARKWEDSRARTFGPRFTVYAQFSSFDFLISEEESEARGLGAAKGGAKSAGGCQGRVAARGVAVRSGGGRGAQSVRGGPRRREGRGGLRRHTPPLAGGRARARSRCRRSGSPAAPDSRVLGWHGSYFGAEPRGQLGAAPLPPPGPVRRIRFDSAPRGRVASQPEVSTRLAVHPSVPPEAGTDHAQRLPLPKSRVPAVHPGGNQPACQSG